MTVLKIRKHLLGTLVVLSGLWTVQPNSYANITTSQELVCLAKNIYYEARGESYRGKLAVAQVTLNRVDNINYQNTICKVVYAPNQFSWTKDKAVKHPQGPAWLEALELANSIIENGVALPGFRALYFHNHTVLPTWSKTKQRIAQIGNHVFYN